MDNITIPILVITRIEIDGLIAHSSDDWLLAIAPEIKQVLKRIAAVLENNVYRKIGKRQFKTSAFPPGKIIFGSWTDNDERAGYIGIYWSIEPRDASFESLMTSIKLTALELSENIVSAFGLLKICAREESFPGERSFFTKKDGLGMPGHLALAIRNHSLVKDVDFEVIQPGGKKLTIRLTKTCRLPFKRKGNLKGALRNIMVAGPQNIKGTINIEKNQKTIKVEYQEKFKMEIFDILKSEKDWDFEFQVYHEFTNGIATITKLHIVEVIGPCESEDLFKF